MQPIKLLADVLENLTNPEHYLFSLRDISVILPGHNAAAIKAVVGRAVQNGLLSRVCRGLFLYPKVDYPAGLVLYHAAAQLRANEFNYISLESVLSDAGVISQIPLNWITLMSSGRSYITNCGSFGHIEFIHTKKYPTNIETNITYDPRCRLWRASVALALRDMTLTGRNTNLVDREVAREFV